MDKEFEGELKWIDAKFLITENHYSQIESVFLCLSLIFNDIKGLILFEDTLINIYKKPDIDNPNCHLGNYSGVLIQIQKLIVGTINEFFIFLKKNTEVFATNEFKEILEKIPKENREIWKSLLAAAHGNFPNVSDFLKAIIFTRNNVSFHYDHSGKILRNAYISRFFGKVIDKANLYAYYSSVANDNNQTRFFFADAALEESMYIAAGKKSKESSFGNPSLKKYNEQLKDTLVAVSNTIAYLVNGYITSKRNRPH